MQHDGRHLVWTALVCGIALGFCPKPSGANPIQNLWQEIPINPTGLSSARRVQPPQTTISAAATAHLAQPATQAASWITIGRHQIKANGMNRVDMDRQWFSCCGDGSALAVLDDSMRTMKQMTRQRRRRGLVRLTQKGTAIPLSFEVSRRVHVQTAPEPGSAWLLLGLGSIWLLRRKRKPAASAYHRSLVP